MPCNVKPIRDKASMVNRLLDDVPDSWLDSLLTGPHAALSDSAGRWGCPDIEKLLKAIKDRMSTTAKEILK